MVGLFDLANGAERKRRNVFFSFHYADIMRVNNVRNCGKFKTNTVADVYSTKPSIEGFYDYSLWESKKLTGPEALKNLIRDGVKNTSAVCVLVGSETYARPWVRYEIARSVIDERGLLAVHLNSINHHIDRRPHLLGPNPLEFIGVYKRQDTPVSIPSYFLYEKNQFGQWSHYSNYVQNVRLPRYLPDPRPGYVMPLSAGASVYDFAYGNGHADIGSWIDTAARRAGYL